MAEPEPTKAEIRAECWDEMWRLQTSRKAYWWNVGSAVAGAGVSTYLSSVLEASSRTQVLATIVVAFIAFVIPSFIFFAIARNGYWKRLALVEREANMRAKQSPEHCDAARLLREGVFVGDQSASAGGILLALIRTKPDGFGPESLRHRASVMLKCDTDDVSFNQVQQITDLFKQMQLIDAHAIKPASFSGEVLPIIFGYQYTFTARALEVAHEIRLAIKERASKRKT